MALSKQLIFLFVLFSLLGCGRKESKEGIEVTILPNFFKLPSGGEVQFSADVSGTLNKGVTWEVTGPLGTSISTEGRFRAPLNAGGKTATLRAVSQEDPNTFGNASVSMTSFSKEIGETVPPGSDRLIVGGYTVRAGQTIDLNGDNLLDLISVNPSGPVTVYFGIGGAKFLKKAEIPVSEPSAVTMGDFVNTSGFVADFAIASRSEQAVKIIPGQPGSAQNSFTAPDPIPTLSLSLFPSALAAGRFHGDVESRNSDLAVGTEDGSILLFLQNRCVSCAQVDFSPQPAVTVGGKITQLVPADFNGDDLLDLAVLREGISDVLVFLGDGAGALSGPISIPFTSAPTSLAVGDFNDDEISDLAAAHAASNQVSISFGKGDGTFDPPRFTSVDSAPTSISTGDFNLGGKTDIAVALPASKAVLLLFGDGSGQFISKLQYDTGVAPLSLVPGFFTSFNSPQGFQSVGLIYISGTENKFYLLNNTST
ncbi:MAG: VCBS repeat-containing protein [Candidatus Manganitrophaceae bacterium]|nr:MAG: VCBS repeat-containing protein [Candidatus Manganitrophaceae bacterium]